MPDRYNSRPFEYLRNDARRFVVMSMISIGCLYLVAVALYLTGFKDLGLGLCVATACLMWSGLWATSLRRKLRDMISHPPKMIVELKPGNVSQVGFDCCSDIAVIDRKNNIELQMTDIIRISEAYKLEDKEDWERLESISKDFA